MKILNIDCELPSSKIDNQEVIDMVMYFSSPVFNGNLEELKSRLINLLERTGIKTRYWRNKNERALDLVEKSFINSIKNANIDKKIIDTVIYTGVDRGFIEPANACFFAKKLGLQNARTFDISDACMGWCTAVEIVQSLMLEGKSEVSLIISSEFPMDKKGFLYPENFRFNNIDEIRWKFPSLTIGEGTTVTILGKSESYWNFNFFSDSNKVDLCTIPLYKYKEYSEKSQFIKKANTFSAYGKELYFAGYKHSLDILKLRLGLTKEEPCAILPHSVSSRVIEMAEKKINLSDKFYTTFPFLGNLATSSIPANIYYGLLSGRLKKNDYLLGWIASAGLKYSCFDIYL